MHVLSKMYHELSSLPDRLIPVSSGRQTVDRCVIELNYYTSYCNSYEAKVHLSAAADEWRY